MKRKGLAQKYTNKYIRKKEEVEKTVATLFHQTLKHISFPLFKKSGQCEYSGKIESSQSGQTERVRM